MNDGRARPFAEAADLFQFVFLLFLIVLDAVSCHTRQIFGALIQQTPTTSFVVSAGTPARSGQLADSTDTDSFWREVLGHSTETKGS